jgi:hypothetical protein
VCLPIRIILPAVFTFKKATALLIHAGYKWMAKGSRR